MLTSIALAVAHVRGPSGFKRLRVASPAGVLAGILRQQSFFRRLALCANHRFGLGVSHKFAPNMRFNPNGFAAG
jgi:hypothetical protein